MRRPRALLSRFVASERGTSAIEMALVLPVLILLMLAGVQVVLYINASRKVALVANSISEMISQATPPNAGTTVATINSLDFHFSYDSTLVLFPYLMTDAARQGIGWWQDITIRYASIQFTQTGTTCAGAADQSACYAATVAWTTTGAFSASSRPCLIPQLPADDTATPTNATLPRSLFGPGSVIAIDVSFTFVPTFGANFISPILIKRSVFVQPRYATLIKFDMSTYDGSVTACPGF